MERCVFCESTVHLVDTGLDLMWIDGDARTTCDDAGTAAHYPGREADLFWRGSAQRRDDLIDLTGPVAVVRLVDEAAPLAAAPLPSPPTCR